MGQNREGRLFRLTVGLVVCGWFVAAFHAYMPAVDSAALSEIFLSVAGMLTRWSVVPFLLTAWVAVSAFLIGEKFLDVFGVPLNPGMERRWLSVTLGLSLFSLAAFLLGAVRLLNTAAAYALLILPLGLVAGNTRDAVARLRAFRPSVALPEICSLRSLARGLVMALGVLCLGLALLVALAPEIEFDPLVTHLAAAKEFAQHHSLRSLVNTPPALAPRSITLLFTLGLLLKKSGAVAKLINYLLGLLACWGVCAWGTRRFSFDSGLVAGVILASSPIFLWEMGSAHVDCGFALYVFLSLYAVVEWLESGDARWRALAIYGTAFSLGIKYQALFSLGALTVVVAAYPLISEPPSTGGRKWGSDLWRDVQASGAQAVRFFSLAAWGLIPWGIVNFSATRDPLFPLLNGIFKSRYWSPEQAALALQQFKDSATAVNGTHWWRIFTNAWDMVMDQQGHFHGNIGIFYLLLVPLIVLRKKIPLGVRMILLFSLVYWVFWLFTAQLSRYFLGALPGLAVVAAYACVSWLETLRERGYWTAAGAAGALLAGMALLSTPLFERYGASARYGRPIFEVIPTTILTGEETRDQFLARNLEDYAVVTRLNSLPGRKRVLFWWNAQPIAFYVNGETLSVFSRLFGQMSSASPARLLQLLRDNGVTHVIVGQAAASASPFTDPAGDFVHQHLQDLYRRNGMILYAVSPVPLTQEVTAFDLLDHLEEAAIRMPSQPRKPNGSYRGVLRVGPEQRYSLLTFPPAEVEFHVTLGQNTDQHMGQHLALRFGTGREFPPCQVDGSFQVLVKAAQGEPKIIFTMDASGSDERSIVAWADHEIDLSPYANQSVALTLKTTSAYGDACNWFLWSDPRVVSRP